MGLEHLQSIDWTFHKIRAKDGIHGLHPYPAMMAPPIAQILIEELSKPYDVVLDPFVGSGVVTSTAMRLKRYSVGLDINPLAILISRVKANPIPYEKLKSAFSHIKKLWNKLDVEPPRFNNIDFWFKPEVQKKLAVIKASIETLQDEKIRDFFLVVLSRVVREVSNTRKDEFKLYRIPENRLKNWNPDAFYVFQKVFSECAFLMRQWFYETRDSDTFPFLEIHDSRKPLPVKPESVDIVLTSPPYGDSRTTVAYGQFSRLSLQWLGLWSDDIDRLSLGGDFPERVELSESQSPTLYRVLGMISDEKRAKDVLNFYSDLALSLRNIVKSVKPGGYLVFVIANRKVKGIILPSDKIIMELLPDCTLISSFSRKIPHKRMPFFVSPSNIPGEIDNTMLAENILIFRKVSK